jgi:hypothetical protein
MKTFGIVLSWIFSVLFLIISLALWGMGGWLNQLTGKEQPWWIRGYGLRPSCPKL